MLLNTDLTTDTERKKIKYTIMVKEYIYIYINGYK